MWVMMISGFFASDERTMRTGDERTRRVRSGQLIAREGVGDRCVVCFICFSRASECDLQRRIHHSRRSGWYDKLNSVQHTIYHGILEGAENIASRRGLQ